MAMYYVDRSLMPCIFIAVGWFDKFSRVADFVVSLKRDYEIRKTIKIVEI